LGTLDSARNLPAGFRAMAALDPQCRMPLDVVAQHGLPELHEMGVEEARTVYFLTRASMVWFRDLYFVRPDDRSNPLGSPLASNDLNGLPPALVITAEFDPLRDEAEAYAHKLQAAGVPCRLTRYDGAIHAFMSMYAYLECGRAAVREAADAVRSAVGT
jgi:acetyl esterase/lipase